MVLGLALLSLALVIVGWAVGGRPTWTSWALPVFLAVNAAVALSTKVREYPQVLIAYRWAAALAALVILVASVWQFWHRVAAIYER